MRWQNGPVGIQRPRSLIANREPLAVGSFKTSHIRTHGLWHDDSWNLVAS
jgi:hypothetical protein